MKFYFYVASLLTNKCNPIAYYNLLRHLFDLNVVTFSLHNCTGLKSSATLRPITNQAFHFIFLFWSRRLVNSKSRIPSYSSLELQTEKKGVSGSSSSHVHFRMQSDRNNENSKNGIAIKFIWSCTIKTCFRGA